MKEIAIIGPTASGKTSLSIEMAHKTNSIILSVDSLSVYKQIDIASAKPSLNEREGIKHFGIDVISPKDNFDVMMFLDTYYNAKIYAQENSKNLLIVGGTGFYIKALVEGLSQGINEEIALEDTLQNTYNFLYKLDPIYMNNIASNDTYRITKAYSIYKISKMTPSEYFMANPKTPIAPNLKLFEILWPRDELKKRIALRTKIMLKQGVLDEVIDLEKEYTREPNCMSSIGILESLEYLDGKITKERLEEKISMNTAKLAKRQATFNKGQFIGKVHSDFLENLNSEILKHF